MIHTALHNLGSGRPESIPLCKNRWQASDFLIAPLELRGGAVICAPHKRRIGLVCPG